MYHMIFHSSKHKKTNSYWGRSSRSINRSSTHNQFELDTIRGSMKSRWELHGAGELASQKAIWQVEERQYMEAPTGHLHKYMNGHIITVETATDAMWFRLNHENVSKNGCKMIEMYRDLDEERIQTECRAIIVKADEINSRVHVNSYLTQARNSVNRFVNNKEIADDPNWYNRATELGLDLEQLQEDHAKDITRLKSGATKLTNKLTEYLEAHRTLIAQ